MSSPADNPPLVPSRYALRRELGRGATSVVYEVFDSVSGANVALKVVHATAVDLVGEFRLMSHLPPHPALARPIEFHAAGDAGCFTMELAPGRPLDRWIAAGGPVEHITEVARALAAGLSVLHAHGHSHGDLKPANIIVDAHEGRVSSVRIVDLGLGRAVDPDDRARTSGTWRYMAPELFLGGTPGPATDLYALGVLLYEWVAGRPPVAADTPGELARGILFGPPPDWPAAPAGAAWVPSVLQKLLARRPEDRFSDAGILEGLLGGEPVPARAPAGLSAEPPFTGREREMEILVAAFERASGGEPVLLRISGAPGVGRSRLLKELRQRHLPRIAGWFEIGAEGAPPLARFARIVARLTGREELLHPAAGEPPAGESHPAPTGAGEVDLRLAERVQLLEELVPVLPEALRRAGEGTLVFVFDECDGGDGALGTSLDYMAVELGEGRVLFVMVSTGEGGTGPGESAEAGVTLYVPPLESPAMTALVTSVAGERLPAAEVRRLVELSGGIPLLALLLAAAVRGAGREPGGPDLPASLADWLRREWERLELSDAAAVPVLEAAAILRPRFDAATIAAVSGCDLVPVLETMARLSRAGGPLLRQGRTTTFHYPVAAGWIEERISPERRRSLHLAAARALAPAAESLRDRESAEAMARHWLSTERTPDHRRDTIGWCHRAAVKAYEAFDWAAAREWAEAALNLFPPGSEEGADLRLEILGLCARAAGLAGANTEAATLFHRLAAETADPVAAARAIARHAQILQSTLGDTTAAREAVEKALARLPQGTAELERARLLEVASEGARIRGDMEAAIAAGVSSLGILERIGAGPVERSRVLATLGYTRLFTGDQSGARADLDRARELAREAGDLYAEARALSHLAVVEGRLGDYPAIRRHLEASLAIAEQIQDVRRAAAIEQSMAVADLYEARFDDARRRLARGRRLAVAIGDRQILTYFDLTLGSVERSAGRFDAAVTALLSAETLANESGIVLARALAETNLGWVALLRGRLDEARALLTKSSPDAARDPMASVQALSILGLLRMEEGNPGEAARLAREAIRISRDIGSPKFEPMAIDLSLRADLLLGHDPGRLLEEAGQGLALAERLHVPEYQVHLLSTGAMISLEARRLDAAAASGTAARNNAREHGLLPALVRALDVLSRVWLAHGGLYDDRAEDALEEGAALAREIGMESAALGMDRRLEDLRSAWET